MVRPKGKGRGGTSGPDGQPTPQDYISRFKGYRTTMAVLNQLGRNTVFPGTGVSIPKPLTSSEKEFNTAAKKYMRIQKQFRNMTVPIWEDRNIDNIGSKLNP